MSGNYEVWAHPFVWIGMNPITIYMIHNLVAIDGLHCGSLAVTSARITLAEYGEVAVSLVGMAITFGICLVHVRAQVFLAGVSPAEGSSK